MSEQRKVTLGDVEVPVYAQKHAYITNKLGKLFVGLIQDGTNIETAAGLTGVAGGNAYRLLATMLPMWGRQVPEWEFMGYSSRELYETLDENGDRADPDFYDKVPDVPQMIEAFSAIAEVNRLDVLKSLWKAIGLDPQMLRRWVNAKVAEKLSSTMQPISPAPEAGSETSTPSGTTVPTSTESEDSPFPASEISPEPTPDDEASI